MLRIKNVIYWAFVFFSTACIVPGCGAGGKAERYYSRNLAGHAVYAEQVGSAAVHPDDAAILSYADHGAVIANARLRPVYVNANGYRKFVEVFPDGAPLRLGIYRYRAQVRLPVAPSTANGERQPQAVHLMVQLWDGAERLWDSNRCTLEGAIYWELNPWDTDNFGKIKVYTGGLELFDTGIRIEPDTSWHTFELTLDLRTGRYESLLVDGNHRDLRDQHLCRVQHDDWGSDLSLTITTESMNAYSQGDQVFWWETHFRELSLCELDSL